MSRKSEYEPYTPAIKISLSTKEDLQPTWPIRGTNQSVGLDLYTAHREVLCPYGRPRFIDTGIIVKPSIGYHVEVFLRSSMAKQHIILCNHVGIIDPDYCGPNDTIKLALRYLPPIYNTCEHGTVLHFSDSEPLTINTGTKIAQLVVRKTIEPIYEMIQEPSKEINRGGFGSTGE